MFKKHMKIYTKLRIKISEGRVDISGCTAMVICSSDNITPVILKN